MNEKLQIIISAEISKLQQNLEKAKQGVKGFQDKVKEAGKNVDGIFSSIGSAVGKGAKAVATGIAAAGTALLALGASTAEYRAEQAKLVSAFETVGSSAEQAKTTYNDLYRVLGDTGSAVEAAQQLANITQEESKLAEYSTICQGVYAKWGTAIDIPGFAEAINHTIELGSVQGTMADGLEWLGITTDEFNAKLAECSSIEEREALVRSTLTGLYGEAAAAYEENNAQVLAQNEANANLQATLALLGEAVAPVVTAFTSFANDALAVVTPYIQSLADQYLPNLQGLLDGVAAALGNVFNWMTQHKTALGIITGLLAGLVVAIGLYNAVAAVKAAMAALEVTTVWGLVAAYAAQAAAMIVAIAPYALIVAAIAAVIAIIVVCVKNWDTIKAKVVEVAAAMKERIVAAKDAVVQGFQNMVSSAQTKLSNIASTVKAKFEAVKSGIQEKINAAKNVVKNGLDAIKNFFSGANWKLPKIKLPHFSISGEFSLNPPSIPSISVDWYAKGGVFDSPTLFGYGGNIGGLGEAGAEAIVPLEETKWIDVLAARMIDKVGANRPVVLEVDGNVFARTAISTINQNTRQTGKLALNLI